MDKDNSEISISFFNELVDKFYSVVQENKIYLISDGRIAYSNKQYL